MKAKSDEAKRPQLGHNEKDVAAAIARSIAGAVPLVGSLLAELVTRVIPDQRTDRLEKYLLQLSEELDKLSKGGADVEGERSQIFEAENIDLIETGASLAVRAVSSDRMKYIVKCVANGIGDDDRNRIHHRRVLSLLSELDDEEIAILHAYGSEGKKLAELRPPAAYLGAPQSVVERDAMFQAALDKLERLGLLNFKPSMRKVKLPPDREYARGEEFEIPKVSFTGRREGYKQISVLGNLVLKAVGLPEPPAS